MHQRRRWITTLAEHDPYYSAEAWHDWYAGKPLSKEHMDDGVKQWKEDFHMKKKTRIKIAECQKQTPDAPKTSQQLSQRCMGRILKANCHPQAVGSGMLQSPTSDSTLLAASMGNIHAISRA